jgi:hypothetical protein
LAGRPSGHTVDLEQAVAEECFREDLYDWLNPGTPHCGKRHEEIRDLGARFLARFNAQYGRQKQLTPETLAAHAVRLVGQRSRARIRHAPAYKTLLTKISECGLTPPARRDGNSMGTSPLTDSGARKEDGEAATLSFA